jgi:copper homeostasis protein CutC
VASGRSGRKAEKARPSLIQGPTKRNIAATTQALRIQLTMMIARGGVLPSSGVTFKGLSQMGRTEPEVIRIFQESA